VEAQRATVAHGAAQDAAQDVVAVGVARLDSVRDGERERADVIADDAEGDVDGDLFRAGSVLVYLLPLIFSNASKIGRKMSVS
jgi:hypothetical protein